MQTNTKCPADDMEDAEAQTTSNMWLWNLFVAVVGTVGTLVSISPQIALVALRTCLCLKAPLLYSPVRLDLNL